MSVEINRVCLWFRVIVFITSFLVSSLVLAGGEGASKAQIEKMSAQEYLHMLCETGDGTLFFDKTIIGWPKKGEVNYLLSKLEDGSTCRSVALRSSSYLDGGGSSVATESHFLLLGVLYGKYPPALNSTRHSLESINEVVEKLTIVHRNVTP